MSADFHVAFEETHSNEGGYVNDIADPGGKTRYGITEEVARDYGYTGEMRYLPIETARAIYECKYWSRLRLGEVHSQGIANEVFDSAVNCGRGRASRWLQDACNKLNDRGKRWEDIAVDGKVGPRTMAVVNAAIGRGVERELDKLLNVKQGHHYDTLCEGNQKFERFLVGWLRKRVKL